VRYRETAGLFADRPATRAELAYWGLQRPAPGMQVRGVPGHGAARLATDGTAACLAVTWPYSPQPGTGSTEEERTTFGGAVADRHPPTGPTTDEAGVEHPGREGVRLLTWGDPYLAAWLEAARGEPLVEADYREAGLAPGSNPRRQTRGEQS
jgi:hypothetical protein